MEHETLELERDDVHKPARIKDRKRASTRVLLKQNENIFLGKVIEINIRDILLKKLRYFYYCPIYMRTHKNILCAEQVEKRRL